MALCWSGVMPCIWGVWSEELASGPAVAASLTMVLQWSEPKVEGKVSTAPLNKLEFALEMEDLEGVVAALGVLSQRLHALVFHFFIDYMCICFSLF
jgi:hypothetical protein